MKKHIKDVLAKSSITVNGSLWLEGNGTLLNMKIIWALLVSCCSVMATHAQLKVTGEVTKPLQLSQAGLAKMTRVSATLKDRDGNNHQYRGVAVIDILQLAGVTTGKQLRGENLSKYLLVKCADGYEVLFSLAEIDTGFTSRVVVLADSLEGKPLPQGKGPFRLIMPGEKVPARSCFQVTEFVVKYGKD